MKKGRQEPREAGRGKRLKEPGTAGILDDMQNEVVGIGGRAPAPSSVADYAAGRVQWSVTLASPLLAIPLFPLQPASAPIRTSGSR